MDNQANKLIKEMADQFNGEQLGGKCAIDNNKTIAFMNDHCVAVVFLYGNETWIQSDNSYITREDDLYYFGNDIDLKQWKLNNKLGV